MDKESNPNAVYRHDPNSQIIYPVDGKTNQPLSEISRYLQEKEQEYVPLQNGIIRNVRKVKLHKTKIDESVGDGEESQTFDKITYDADFVVNVFVVPDEGRTPGTGRTVANVKMQLDGIFGTVNAGNIKEQREALVRTWFAANRVSITRTTTASFIAGRGMTLGESIEIDLRSAREKYTKYLNEEEYHRDKPNLHAYVEKKKNIWVLHPKFENFKLPFHMIEKSERNPFEHEIAGGANKEDKIETSYTHERDFIRLNMKLLVKVISREQAFSDVQENETMANFYVYLSNVATVSMNLFNGSNLILMSSNQLNNRGRELFFHEVGHAFFKYQAINALTREITFEHGAHNLDNASYMSASINPTEFTKNDLFALALFNDPRTYGTLIDIIYKGGNKSDLIEAGKLESELKKPFIRNNFCVFNIFVKKDLFGKNYFRENTETDNTVEITPINIESGITWPGIERLCNNFIFYRNNINVLTVRPSATINNQSLEFFLLQRNIIVNGIRIP